MRQGGPDENRRWCQIHLRVFGQDAPLEESEQPTVGAELVRWYDVDDINDINEFNDVYDG